MKPEPLQPGQRMGAYRIDRMVDEDEDSRSYLVSDTGSDRVYTLRHFADGNYELSPWQAGGSTGAHPGRIAQSPAVLPESQPEGREWLNIILLAVFGLLLLSAIVYLFVPGPDSGTSSPESLAAEPMAPAPSARTSPASAEESRRWESALQADTLFAYRLFLEDFPESVHGDQARRHIERLDSEAWRLAQAERSRASLEAYLGEFPEGRFRADAQIALDQVAREEQAALEARQILEAQDEQAWLAAKNQRSVAAVDQYLGEWPQGMHAGEARQLRRKIESEVNDRRAFEAARNTHTLAAYRDYLAAFPRGVMAAAALEAIDDLTLRPGKRFRDCADCPEMVVVPAGSYWQGAEESSPLALKTEKPRRTVTIAEPFAVGVYEITMAQWDQCVADGGCDEEPVDNGWGRGDRPVIMVSWNDAQQFVSWLSGKTGQSYSLPSESQWEYFARAGEETDWLGGSPERICEFGNIAGQESGFRWQHERCADPAALETLPAGSFRANAFGLHDVVGNVAEWTNDCMNLSYLDAPADGSAWGRGICSSRMTRGGSWFTGTREVRLPARFNLKNGDRNDFTGFRVVRKVEPQ
jgi:formylglycine-generating enzyme required for sulfatase activity